MIVIGTYGLDEAGAWTGKASARARQALAVVKPKDGTAEVNPALHLGLPQTSNGWVEGDIEIGGAFPNIWLERTLRTPAALNKGALFDVAHDGFTWAGSTWRPSAGRDAFLRGPHATLPTASMFCPGDESSAAFSLLAAERALDGTTFIAGRCEDELHRPTGSLLLGRYDVTSHRWQKVTAPASPMFEGTDAIVNAGIVVASPHEAWVHSYRPFSVDAEEKPYLVHFGTAGATAVSLPFTSSIVSLARGSDASLWAVTGFAELRRMHPDGAWEPAAVSLPSLEFVEPVPERVRLLDVQTIGADVWVHGAIPTVREDGSPGREHVLYTSARWTSPLHCDRDTGPTLASGTKKVKLGALPKHTVKSEL